MSTGYDPRRITTPPGVIIGAFIAGILGVLFYWTVGAVVLAFGSSRGELARFGLCCMFIGPVAAASFAGLLGLISGFDLGRYFTLPLMFSLAGVSGLFLPGLLEGSGVKIDGEVLGVLYLWWIIVIGGIGGGILMSIIPGYTRYSRIWAAAGMFVMFVIWYIVTAIDEQNPGVSKSPMIFNFRLTGLPLLLSFGGAVGAAVGSIIDHLTGREEYRPLWVTCPHCGLRFCLDEADQWDGKRHLQCGKRVHIGFA